MSYGAVSSAAGTHAPYCAEILGLSQDVAGAGLAGWAQSSIDDKILNDSGKSADDKIWELFGMKLDWKKYPLVYVTEVNAKGADDQPTRAAKNKVEVGDALIMVGTMKEPITTLSGWEQGKSPNETVIKKIQRKQKRKDNPVAAFAFLRKKYAPNYVQLMIPEGTTETGITTAEGKISEVASGSYAESTLHLKTGDRIVVVGHTLREKNPKEIDKKMAVPDRPLHFLIRREKAITGEILNNAVDVERGWLNAWGAAPGGAKVYL